MGHNAQKRVAHRRSLFQLPSFTRVSTDLRDGREEHTLETAIATYENPDNGKTVTLIGMSHLGSAEYYAEIQAVLDQHQSVFYEGINNKINPVPWYRKLSPSGLFFRAESYWRKSFRKAAGLESQAAHIKYKERPQWTNVDISANDLIRYTNRGVALNPVSRVLNYAKMYAGAAAMAVTAPFLRFSSPEKCREKLINRGAHESDHREPIIGGLREGLVTDHLRQWNSDATKRKLAVQYGAHHQLELQRYLVIQLGYKLKDVQWLKVL